MTITYKDWAEGMTQAEIDEVVEDHMQECDGNCTTSKDALLHEYEIEEES